MKRLLYIILAVLSGVAFSGCVMYSDKDEAENPQLDVNDLIYLDCVEPVFRVAELADFFDRYQAVREDREASEALGLEYFGDSFDPSELFYEEFTARPYWGKVILSDNQGEYVVYPAGNRWNDMYTDYNVQVLGSRRYRIVCDSADDDSRVYWKSVATDATVYYDADDIMHVEILDIVYTEDIEGESVTVEVTSDDGSLAIPLCSRGEYNVYPGSGIMQFSISGDVSDVFSVRYHDDVFEIISGSNSEILDK